MTRRARRLGYPDRVLDGWEELVLGEDEHGEWAVVPAGTPMRRTDGPPARWRGAMLHCYPRDGWWVAAFLSEPRMLEIARSDGGWDAREVSFRTYVHMATVPVVRDGVREYMDLILDVIERPDGEVVVLDEHEVDQHRARWGIPDAFIEQARASCEWVAAAMRAGAGPFGDASARWLARYAGPSG